MEIEDLPPLQVGQEEAVLGLVLDVDGVAALVAGVPVVRVEDLDQLQVPIDDLQRSLAADDQHQ